MGNYQPALRAPLAYESGHSEPEIRLEHAFVLLIWQLAIKEARQMAKFARCSFAKTTANALILSVTHLISSMSRAICIDNVSLGAIHKGCPSHSKTNFSFLYFELIILSNSFLQ
jgi:hypothetical protein